MDASWIILVWLLAIAAIYFGVTYWSRIALVRRRLFSGAEESEYVVGPDPAEETGWLTRWLMLAGFRSASAPGTFIVACIASALVGGLIVLLLLAGGLLEGLQRSAAALPPSVGSLLLPVLSALPWVIFVGLVALPWLYVRAERRLRVEDIERGLPITLDLLATMAETGLGFDASLAKIVESEPEGGALHDELRLFQLESLGGVGRIGCFRRLAARCEVGSMSVFCSALVQAEQVGAGFSSVLRQQADDLRGRRRERAMVMAQALPVKLVFPLVLCFLPGIFLTTLGPAFMQFFQMIEGVIRSS